jgi:hypothetical protein
MGMTSRYVALISDYSLEERAAEEKAA